MIGNTRAMTHPDDRTRTLSGLAEDPVRAGDRSDDRPLGDRISSAADSIRAETPRTHPIAYLALLLSLIALIGLAVSAGDGDEFELVKVGNQDCASVPQDEGPAVLYCRTNTTVK